MRMLASLIGDEELEQRTGISSQGGSPTPEQLVRLEALVDEHVDDIAAKLVADVVQSGKVSDATAAEKWGREQVLLLGDMLNERQRDGIISRYVEGVAVYNAGPSGGPA